MNKLKFFTFLLASFLMLSLVSCDKKDKEIEPSKTELLTAGVWTGDEVYSNGQRVTDFFTEFGIDIKQAKFNFKKDGTATSTYGDDEPFNTTWEFRNGETEILVGKGDEDEFLFKLLKLTKTELHVEVEEVLDDDLTIKAEYRFKR